MSATDTIRAMLDERGVELEACRVPTLRSELAATFWYDRDGNPCSALEGADDVPDGMLSVQANLTPEQAIEATLGSGECELLGYDDGVDEAVDGEWVQYAPPRWFLSCGHDVEGSEKPNYCPSCGRKVRA